MKRILENIKYKLKYQLNWMILYIALFTVSIFTVYYFLMKTEFFVTEVGGFGYRIWGGVLFFCALSFRFKEDFDFLTTLSNTRKNIFFTMISVTSIYSIVFGLLTVLEKIIIDCFNNYYGFNNKDIMNNFSPYYSNNLLLQFFFFLALCTLLSTFGLLMGSLFYRYGKKFVTAFWILISVSPIIILPLKNLGLYLKIFGRFLNGFNVLFVSGQFLIMSIVLGVLAYINIIKLEQA